MRKLVWALLVASIFVTTELYSAEEEEDCYVHVRIDQNDPNAAPGHLGWNSADKACTYVGNDCEMIPCDQWESGKITGGPSSGHTLNTQLSDIPFNRLIGGSWTKIDRGDGDNFPFTAPYVLRVMSCTDPAFIGQTVSLDGITTDNTGKFSVYLP